MFAKARVTITMHSILELMHYCENKCECETRTNTQLMYLKITKLVLEITDTFLSVASTLHLR